MTDMGDAKGPRPYHDGRIRVRMNKPAADQLTQSIVTGFNRMGSAADAVGKAADSLSSAAATQAHPTFRLWGAVAWADLLRRFTGR